MLSAQSHIQTACKVSSPANEYKRVLRVCEHLCVFVCQYLWLSVLKTNQSMLTLPESSVYSANRSSVV